MRCARPLVRVCALVSAAVALGACQSSAPTCSNDVAERCSATGHCLTSWPSSPKAFCDGADWSVGECGGYRVAVRVVVDVIETYYYDAKSGNLVAIEFGGSVSKECSGPSDFEAPSCDFTSAGCFGSDAGLDASTD